MYFICEFLHITTQRYNVPPNVQQSTALIIQIRVINLLYEWLMNYYSVDFTPPLLKCVQDFMTTLPQSQAELLATVLHVCAFLQFQLPVLQLLIEK